MFNVLQYLIVPVICLVIWIFHVVDWWKYLQSTGLAKWLVLAGFPFATIVFSATSGAVLIFRTPGADTDSLRVKLVVMSLELLFAWIASWFVEFFMFLIARARRIDKKRKDSGRTYFPESY